MQDTLDKLITESKEALEDIKSKIEASSTELSDDAGEFWSDLKSNYEEVHSKLEDASKEYTDKAEKDAYLSMMEAKHKLLDLQDITERFTADILNKTEKKIDVAQYKAELAKLKAENKWDAIKVEVSEAYETSKDEVQKLASAASNEVKDMFAKIKSLV